jgi:DNA repair protein RadC
MSSLKDLPAALRPREKLLAQGPAALADAELLAVLLRTGMRGLGVLAWADQILRHFNGLGGLMQADAAALRAVKGLGGTARRAELLAVMELARRALQAGLRSEPVFDSPTRVREYLSLQLAERPHEVFAALFLDAQHRLIEYAELFRGTLTQTSVYPREVVKQALACNAAALILAHNHPSGVAEPSRADELLTQSLRQALGVIDVRVLDHIVVGREGTVSFAERGLL